MRLRGKVALVTGAQQGIGRGIALAFAHEGADVAVNYLDDRTAAETVLRQVQAAGRRATLVQADVARPADARAMVTRVVEELGGLDILVNNAGVTPGCRSSRCARTTGTWSSTSISRAAASAPRPPRRRWSPVGGGARSSIWRLRRFAARSGG